MDRKGRRKLKLEALDHPKTFDLAARLNVELPTVIGYLELLWSFTSQKTPQGNVGKWPNVAIARACYWNGDADSFVSALCEAGFLDRDPQHRLVVHDWKEHCHSWVRAKLTKLGLHFIEAAEPTAEGIAVPDVEATASRSSSLGKSSLGKPSLTTASVEAIRAVYPKRAGNQPWGKAEKAISARLREGHTEKQLIDGAERYAAFVRATGKEGTEYVMQAATFCGPDKRFLESWELPKTKADTRLAANLSAVDEFMQRTG